METLIPLFLILGGVIAITIYCLVMALKNAVDKLAKISEQLMIMATTKEGSHETARALVASARLPRQEIPGIAKKKPIKEQEEKPGQKITVGFGLG